MTRRRIKEKRNPKKKEQVEEEEDAQKNLDFDEAAVLVQNSYVYCKVGLAIGILSSTGVQLEKKCYAPFRSVIFDTLTEAWYQNIFQILSLPLPTVPFIMTELQNPPNGVSDIKMFVDWQIFRPLHSEMYRQNKWSAF